MSESKGKTSQRYREEIIKITVVLVFQGASLSFVQLDRSIGCKSLFFSENFVYKFTINIQKTNCIKAIIPAACKLKKTIVCKYISTSKVLQRPPPKRITAPKEVKLKRKISSAAEIIEGFSNGKTTFIQVNIEFAPSIFDESFSDNLLEYPQYTRPQVWVDAGGNKHHVPEVLVSGHHEKIKEWRKKKSIEVTKRYRPDLLKK